MTLESVRIRRAHARPLAGNLHVPERQPAGAVLILHGFKGFKDWGFFPHLAGRLAEAGILALRVNLSGSGVREDGDVFDDPEGFETSTLSKDLEDAAASAAFLQSRTDLPIGLFGHSRGGGIAVVLAALHPDVRALVTWASIADADRFGPEADAAWERGETWPVRNARTGEVFQMRRDFHDDLERNRERFTIRRRAAEIAIPWLIVHGAEDESVPPGEGEELHRASAPNGRSRLLVVPGAGHTFGAGHPFGGETEPLRLAIDATIAWFRTHLAGRVA